MGVILGLYKDTGKENGIYYLGFRALGPMINQPPLFKGLNIRIPSLILNKGKGFMNQGSTLGVEIMGGSHTKVSYWTFHL